MDQALQNNQAQFDRICQKMKRLLIKKQNLTHSTPQEVVPGIFLSNFTFSINKKFITANNIGLIVSCVKIDDKDRIKGVNYKQLLIKDKPEQKISQYFDQISSLITSFLLNDSGRKCLMNCFSGKSRSPTLLLSYLINSRKISFQQALQIVKKKYLNAQPNSGFINQLKQYEKKFKVEDVSQQSKQEKIIIQQKQQTKEYQEKKQNKQKIEQQEQNVRLQQKNLNNQKNTNQQELIQNQQNNKENQLKMKNNESPLQTEHQFEKGLNQGQENEKFQILEGQKVQQKILSQNSAQQPPTIPTEQQNINQNKILVTQKQKQQKQSHIEQNFVQPQVLQQKGEQKQKQQQKFEQIQSQQVKVQIQQEQHKSEKEEGLQKQQNKSENQQKVEVVTTTQPRKKKKKHKKKKGQH